MDEELHIYAYFQNTNRTFPIVRWILALFELVPVLQLECEFITR